MRKRADSQSIPSGHTLTVPEQVCGVLPGAGTPPRAQGLPLTGHRQTGGGRGTRGKVSAARSSTATWTKGADPATEIATRATPCHHFFFHVSPSLDPSSLPSAGPAPTCTLGLSVKPTSSRSPPGVSEAREIHRPALPWRPASCLCWSSGPPCTLAPWLPSAQTVSPKRARTARFSPLMQTAPNPATQSCVR